MITFPIVITLLALYLAYDRYRRPGLPTSGLLLNWAIMLTATAGSWTLYVY